MTIKYIAHCKKWRDKINGNTYHSVRITDVNTKDIIKIPFTYGYGEQYKSNTLNELCRKNNTSKFNLYHDFIHWVDEENCKMKDVKNWGS
jgi:hypothetical protein|tara:strand:- start:138 stop:407 length:270 start_codon:yes stop_codon:yes gene_type:complete